MPYIPIRQRKPETEKTTVIASTVPNVSVPGIKVPEKRGFFEPVPEKVRVRDFLREVPGAVKQVSKEIGQGIVRSFGATEAAIRQRSLEAKVPITPTVEKLTGRKEPFGFREIGQETLAGFGVSEEKAKRLGLGAGLLVAGLDVLPFPKGKIPKIPKVREVPFVHYGSVPGIKELDPKFQFTGAAGTEQAAKAAHPELFTPRTYLYHPTQAPEPSIAAGRFRYTGIIKGKVLELDYGVEHQGVIDKFNRITKAMKIDEADELGRTEAFLNAAKDSGYDAVNLGKDRGIVAFSKIPLTTQLQVGITPAQPANRLVNQLMKKGDELFQAGKPREAISVLNKVPSKTAPQLTKVLQDEATGVVRMETAHGLYGGTPEPSHWLELTTTNPTRTVGSLAQYAKANVQDSFFTAERAVPDAVDAVPGFRLRFSKRLSPKDIVNIQEVAQKQGLGLTLNPKTSEAVIYNIKQFDNLDPDDFIIIADNIFSELKRAGYSLGREFGEFNIKVYTKDTYDQLIQLAQTNQGVKRAVSPRRDIARAATRRRVAGDISQKVPPGKPPTIKRRIQEAISPEPRRIIEREDILLRAKIRAEARGAKAGFAEGSKITREQLLQKFRESKTTVAELRKGVLEYIKRELPPQARGKFLQAIINATTKKRQVSIFGRVEKTAEELIRRDIITELKEIPKALTEKNIALDYRRRIEDTMRGINLVKPTKETLRKLQSLQSYIAKVGSDMGIPKERIEALGRLSRKNVASMTAADLDILRENITRLRDLGELKLQLKFKYNLRERKQALDKLVASSHNIDPPTVDGKLSALRTAELNVKKIYMDTMQVPRVADYIDNFQGYKGQNAHYVKRLNDAETLAKNEVATDTVSALEEIQSFGVKELTQDQQVRMMINIRQREGALDQVKTLLDTYGFDEVPKLTEQEGKIIETLKKYTNKRTDKIAAIFEEVENKPFKKLKEYILPIKYEREFNLLPSQTIEQTRHRTTQAEKGFTIERVKGVKRVPRVDIFGVFEEALKDQAWYMRMQPEIENVKYLALSNEYKVAAGELAQNFWKDLLDVTARRGWSATARSNPLMRQTRLNINTAVLGYKLSSILMQPFSVFDAMAYAQSRYGTVAALQILAEFSKSWVIPKYAKKIIAESPALQVRRGGELAIEETLQAGTKGFFSKVVRGGMSLLQRADIRTAAGAEKAFEKILMRQGMVASQVKKEAEFLMNLTQSSAEVTYRPLILSRGEGARTFFTFQTFFLNRWGTMAHDLITTGLIKGSWKQKYMALTGLGIFLAGQIAEDEARRQIAQLSSGKEIEKKSIVSTLLTAIPENIPYFGQLLRFNGSTEIPVQRTIEETFRGGKNLFVGKKPETKARGAIELAEGLGTLVPGVFGAKTVPGLAQISDLLKQQFPQKQKKSEGIALPSIEIPGVEIPSIEIPGVEINL